MLLLMLEAAALAAEPFSVGLDMQYGVVDKSTNDIAFVGVVAAATVGATRDESVTISIPAALLSTGCYVNFTVHNSCAPQKSLGNVSADAAFSHRIGPIELRGGFGLSLPTADNFGANALYAGYRVADFGLFNPNTTTIRARLAVRRDWRRLSLEVNLGADEHYFQLPVAHSYGEATPSTKKWRYQLRGGASIVARPSRQVAITLGYAGFLPFGAWVIAWSSDHLSEVREPLASFHALELAGRIDRGRWTIEIRLYVPLVGPRAGAGDGVNERYPSPGVAWTARF